MMRVYRSKVDIWLIAVLIVPIGWAVIECIQTSNFNEMTIVLVLSSLIFILLLQIKYVINDNVLEVKAGFFGTERINIKDIRSVSKTYNPLSAPALSINRLEIKYGSNYDYVLISPKNRKEFIEDLTAVNPDINVQL